jgi:hypothetical protein
MLSFGCVAATTWFVAGAGLNGTRDTATTAHPLRDNTSRAAVTAFYRRAEERTADLMDEPAPDWNVCPHCKLAFHGPDTLAEDRASGHTPGDWQP